MNVLVLGPDRGDLAGFIAQGGDVVQRTEAPVGDAAFRLAGVDILVCYGYRHLLLPETLASVGGKAVNLHCSMLPWNRGAHPNLWSFLEGTPKGVTLHVIDDGIDTGPIIAQRLVPPHSGDTLRTSYDRLALEIEALFRTWWPLLREWRFEASDQRGAGSRHSVADLRRVEHLLVGGWDTPVFLLPVLRPNGAGGAPE